SYAAVGRRGEKGGYRRGRDKIWARCSTTEKREGQKQGICTFPLSVLRLPPRVIIVQRTLVRPVKLAIDLSAEEENHQGKPDPGQKAHRGSEIAVDAIVAAEIVNIPSEQQCSQNP